MCAFISRDYHLYCRRLSRGGGSSWRSSFAHILVAIMREGQGIAAQLLQAGFQGALAPWRGSGCPRKTFFSLFSRRRRRRAKKEAWDPPHPTREDPAPPPLKYSTPRLAVAKAPPAFLTHTS